MDQYIHIEQSKGQVSPDPSTHRENMKVFLARYEKIPVQEYPNQVSEHPVVSVCVQTYRHVNYIKSCLNGILMQKTSYPFEILLGEDASDDGTRDICLDYARRYPDKIRLFLHHRENNIKIDGRPSDHFNALYNLYSSRGKYTAKCEGDDYWTDPFKLQKQVDFLEEHPEFGMVSTDVFVIDEKGRIREDTPGIVRQRASNKQEINFYDLLERNWINTLTVCARSHLMIEMANRMMQEDLWFAYDHWFWLHMALKSRIRVFYERTAAYRVHEGGMSRQTGFLRTNRPLVKYDALLKYLNGYETVEKGVYNHIIFKTLATLILNEKLSVRKKSCLLFQLFRRYDLVYLLLVQTLRKVLARSRQSR